MALPRIVVQSGGNDLASGAGSLVVGGRLGADVVVDDPIVADRHCEFVHDGAFRVRDLGSVTGTWVDGRKAAPIADLIQGSKIVIGSSTLVATLGNDGGVPTLTLELERQAFWWKKPSKGTFDNDPDALVRSEVQFGRFPTLSFGNRLAIVAGAALLVAATFVSSVMGALADAGPLLTAHAVLQDGSLTGDIHAGLQKCLDVAREQGCNACHSTGAGATEAKCMQCHGDLREAATWRHPYLGDGKLGDLPGIAGDQAFCVVCHVDHQGKQWLKPAASELSGKCETCHGDRNEALAKAKQTLPKVETVQRPFAAFRFPHDAHIQKDIACDVCHVIDEQVRQRTAQGLPDDPTRQDFADVPFETCAKCHVPGALDPKLTLAKDHQWAVAWHGTDEGGKYCMQCHTQTTRGGRTVYGPEFATVARGVFTTAQYVDERARYTTPVRSHQEQFAAHGAGKDCTVCHLNGNVPAVTPERPRTFWHALHMADGSLTPAKAAGGRISTDGKQGCLSCHADLKGASRLADAATAAYHWPNTASAQAACSECHRDGDRSLPPIAADTKVAAARLGASPAIVFPHDVHVNSKAFGQNGSLAEGCYACHEFATAGADAFALVPRTKAAAASCVQCHAGHAEIGGNTCQQCHPADAARSNSFLVTAAVAPGTALPGRAQPVPPLPQRSWPRNDAFRHLSPGHVGPNITCKTCHEPTDVGKSKDLADVPIPDEATLACRECHLQKQFHWR